MHVILNMDSSGKFELEGVEMTRADLVLFLDINGFPLLENLDKWRFATFAKNCLNKLPVEEFLISMSEFVQLSDDEKNSIRDGLASTVRVLRVVPN